MAYNGPVEESNMAALNSDCLAGNNTCDSALPAPADWTRMRVIASVARNDAHLAPDCNFAGIPAERCYIVLNEV